MFNLLKYNWKIHRLLKRLAKQRVGMVLQPGNVWVLEYAVEDTDETRELLYTCQLRGWVELLHESVPTGKLSADGSLPTGQLFSSENHIWKLTDSGWGAIQRRHVITILGTIVAILSALFAVNT